MRLTTRPAASRLRRPATVFDADREAHLQRARTVVARLCYEIVPVGDIARVVDELDIARRAEFVADAPVTVTCSPTKGLGATLDLTARLLDRGYRTIPHLSARMVEGPEHVRALASWLRDHGVTTVFVVGGDAPDAAGPYPDGHSLLCALLEHDLPVRAVGVPTYPDGHPFIPDAVLADALLDKQELIAEAGLVGWTTTQMCLDATRVRTWLAAARLSGLEMPVHLGIPGVVDRAKLMRLGVRMGVGQSLRYLRKNRRVVTSMTMPGGFDPSGLVTQLPLGDVTGLHAFTFNGVAATSAWQHRFLEEVR